MKRVSIRLLKLLLSWKPVVNALNWCMKVYWRYYRPIIKKRVDYWGCQILKSGEGNDLIARLLETGEAGIFFL